MLGGGGGVSFRGRGQQTRNSKLTCRDSVPRSTLGKREGRGKARGLGGAVKAGKSGKVSRHR